MPPVRIKIAKAAVKTLCANLITAHAATWTAAPRPRASMTPSNGALSACVRGTAKRIGPMIATVCSMAAIDAPYPMRGPRRWPARASATPPASATQNPTEGAARAARNDAVATCASPPVSRSAAAPAPIAWIISGCDVGSVSDRRSATHRQRRSRPIFGPGQVRVRPCAGPCEAARRPRRAGAQRSGRWPRAACSASRRRSAGAGRRRPAPPRGTRNRARADGRPGTR